MKLCPTLLVIRKTQIEVTMRDYHTTAGMVNIKSLTIPRLVNNRNYHTLLRETGGSFLKFLNVERTCSIQPIHSIPRHLLKKNKVYGHTCNYAQRLIHKYHNSIFDN